VLSFLVYYIQNHAIINNSEKVKMKTILLAIMKGLLNVDYQKLEFDA